MHNFNIQEAKTNLSTIIKMVEAGEDVVIMRAGKPVARFMQYQKPQKIVILDGFDNDMPDEWFCFDDPDDPLNIK